MNSSSGARTARDWTVDISCFVLAAGFILLTADSAARVPGTTHGVLVADQVVGALSCAALWLRRRWPVALATVLVALSAFSQFVPGAAAVALFTVAVHRPFRVTAWLGGLAVATTAVYPVVRPDPDLPLVTAILVGSMLYLAVVGWGMFVRSRRQLLLSLRERARRAEAEAGLRAERAQRLTRERIAREMHDVLAHRLSLLSVHAGALEYRPDAPPEQIAVAAGVIRDSAHQALEDLREVIGVLRAPDDEGDDGEGGEGEGGEGEGGGARPQPTLADLPRLVAEARLAGTDVSYEPLPAGGGADTGAGTGADAVPAATGRTAYRIVQEGLTNARKHAPDATVDVRITGAAGEGLNVTVSNPLPATDAASASGADAGGPLAPGASQSAIPGAGQGLIGLAERAQLAGGRLESGAVGGADGAAFRLAAWLPWPS
ncbi:histidine kinase [Streptomyces sp. NPDC050617]|uniref:sensor histidine kinase n=1 Tax=Streptomyces sp. NPDC050617 TaxID=3154628 RepID=UPI00341680D0